MLRPLCLISLAILLNVGCSQAPSEPVEKRVRHTQLKFCRSGNDIDANFRMFNCPQMGDYSLSIGIQDELYILVNLKQKGRIIGSEMERITTLLGQAPKIHFSDTIQWHLWNEQARYMVLPLYIQTSTTNTQYLSAHLIHESRICPLALIEFTTSHFAQQQMTQLMNENFDRLQACPEEILLIKNNLSL